MATFWNFLQDHRYFKERQRSETLASRVSQLEKEISEQRDLMKKLLHALELRLGDDLDGDSVLGKPQVKTITVKKSRDNERIRKQIAKQKSSTLQNKHK